jgi:prepilin-type N-terminal cleavage/methylation domain-containing protein
MTNLPSAPQRNIRDNGFTLLEVLISIGFLGLLLALVNQYLLSGLNLTSTIANQTTLQGEIRSIGAMIGDEVQRAFYVFPPCGEFGVTTDGNNAKTPFATFGTNCDPVDSATDNVARLKVNFGLIKIATSGNTLINLGAPANKRYEWYIGAPPPGIPISDPRTAFGAKSYPMLAMITGPRDPQVQCRMTDAAGKPIDAESAVNADGCYQFVAYYPVQRKCLSSGATLDSNCVATGPAQPGSRGQLEPNDETSWVLMEYRRNLSRDISPNPSTLAPNINYATAAATTSAWTRSEGGRSFLIPRINWGSVGCGLVNNKYSGKCPSPFTTPNPDPSTVNQGSPNSLPAITRGTSDPPVIFNFRMRMLATKEWIELLGATPASDEVGSGKVLLENIRPNHGFQIDFPLGSIDERGVTEVRLRLQASVKQNGKEVFVPSQPTEFFASPRNISSN